MRVRTPGLRWFDSELDFARRCGERPSERASVYAEPLKAFAALHRGAPVEEAWRHADVLRGPTPDSSDWWRPVQ